MWTGAASTRGTRELQQLCHTAKADTTATSSSKGRARGRGEGSGRAALERRVRGRRPRGRGSAGDAATVRAPRARRRRFPDGDEATVHRFANGDVQEVEETKGNHPTSLIEERLGQELAVVREPTTTSMAETEQSFAVPQLNQAVKVPGGGRELLDAQGSSGGGLVGRGEKSGHTCVPWTWR